MAMAVLVVVSPPLAPKVAEFRWSNSLTGAGALFFCDAMIGSAPPEPEPEPEEEEAGGQMELELALALELELVFLLFLL